MIKIVVYEDDMRKLIDTYSSLPRWGDVHIRYKGEIDEDVLGPLSANGFNSDLVKKLSQDDKPPQADLYFVGELGGDCLAFVQQFPKDKTYLVTENKDLHIEGEKNRYRVISSERISFLVASLLRGESAKYP